MNILLMTDKLITGGAETYFCKLENQLQHPDITMYTAAGEGELLDKLKHKEQFTRISRTNHLKNLHTLSAKVQTHNISIIHANSLRMVLYAIVIKKITRRNIKIVYTKHNLTLLEKYKFVFSNLLNKHVNRIITVSDFEKRSLVKMGIKEERITTIYNGADLGQFDFSEKKHKSFQKVGILARLSEEKNHLLFLEIANKFKHKKDIMFYIGGDGPEREAISEKIRSLGLSDTVQMLGDIKKPEEFIRNMDVLLLTSHREVFPMVIIESMAVGTPIISIDTGGISEAVVDKETGFLIPNYSEEEFAEKICSLQANVDIREKLVKEARRRAEAYFTLDIMIQNTIKQYTGLNH